MNVVDPLREWARARRADILAREHENALRVSCHKPLGGRGFPATMRGFWTMFQEACAVKARAGAHPVRFLPGGGTGSSMWIYAYDVLGLRNTVAEHHRALLDHGWPTGDLDTLVQRIRAEMVPPMLDIYAFVADCYGDKLNPGRAEVLPRYMRIDLLGAYLDEHGEPDPSFIYFHAAGQPIPAEYDAFLPIRSPLT